MKRAKEKRTCVPVPSLAPRSVRRVILVTLHVHHTLRCVCVCSCALSLVRKKRPLIEFPLISRQPRLAERDACLPAAQRHTSGMVDNGG